jgi:hypothetical protein
LARDLDLKAAKLVLQGVVLLAPAGGFLVEQFADRLAGGST